jgi:hypothetical protein
MSKRKAPRPAESKPADAKPRHTAINAIDPTERLWDWQPIPRWPPDAPEPKAFTVTWADLPDAALYEHFQGAAFPRAKTGRKMIPETPQVIRAEAYRLFTKRYTKRKEPTQTELAKRLGVPDGTYRVIVSKQRPRIEALIDSVAPRA